MLSLTTLSNTPSSRLVLTEEANQRDLQASDLDVLRSKYILLEQKCSHFLSTLVTLRESADDEAERTANSSAQVKHDLASVQLALQVGWRPQLR